MRELIGPLYEGGPSGFQHGDVMYGLYCLAQCYAMQMVRGVNLEILEKAMRDTCEMVNELGQDVMKLWYAPYLKHASYQYVRLVWKL
jgi:hypothetical protein